MSNHHVTASEIKLSMERYEEHLLARRSRLDHYMTKLMGKMILRTMTNLGPILWLVEQNIIINKLDIYETIFFPVSC